MPNAIALFSSSRRNGNTGLDAVKYKPIGVIQPAEQA